MACLHLRRAQADASDESSSLLTDGPVHGPAVSLGLRGDQRDPVVRILFRVGIRNRQGLIVDLPGLEMLDVCRLIRALDLREEDLAVDVDAHQTLNRPLNWRSISREASRFLIDSRLS